MTYTKTGPFTDGGAPYLSAAFFNSIETGLDTTVNRRGYVSVTEYGAKLDGTTDDTAAIQAALNTGADVLIAGTPTVAGIAKTTATLVMNAAASGQRLTTRHATIQPAFLGDVLQVTTMSAVQVTILGTLQPTSGDYSNVAAIRIGSASYNPQQASVAYSDVRSFKGSAIIWDHGAMVDFSHFHADTISVDGIRGTTIGDDCNHGWFANTHIVAAAGKGYAFYGDGSNLSGHSSRHHVFQDAKAFGCGQNWYIESRSNVGTVYSENGTTADTLTSTSRGNNLEVIETAAAFESWIDSGVGNRLSGFSTSNTWDTKELRVRTPTIGSTRFSSVVSGMYTIPTATLANGATTNFTPGVTGLGAGRVVNATLFGVLGNGIVLQPYIDAGGNLQLAISNSTGASQTLTGNVISYIIWRFA